MASTVVAALVAVLASPQLADYFTRARPVSPDLYKMVSFPSWVLPDPPVQSLQTALALDSRAMLVVLLVGFLAYRICRIFRARRGRLVVLLIVWIAVILAAALAGAAGSPLINGVLGAGLTQPKYDWLDYALSQAGAGAIYGGILGWLPAVFAAAVAGRRRPRGPGRQ